MSRPQVAVSTSTRQATAAVPPSRATPLILSPPQATQVYFSWDNRGPPVGPNYSCITASKADKPGYVGWVSQLNLTSTPLTVTGGERGLDVLARI